MIRVLEQWVMLYFLYIRQATYWGEKVIWHKLISFGKNKIIAI